MASATIACPRCRRPLRLAIELIPIGGSARFTVQATVPEIERRRHARCGPRGGGEPTPVPAPPRAA